MDRILNNEINTRSNDFDNDIKEFMVELQNSLNEPNSKITIDKSFYNEIFNDIELAKKYRNQLENIIKECMIGYSYDNDFIYVNYDEKNKKYYMDIYDGDVTKVCVDKKDLEESNIKVGEFYYQMNDFKYFEEYKNIKGQLKKQIEIELNKLENNRRVNEQK